MGPTRPNPAGSDGPSAPHLMIAPDAPTHPARSASRNHLVQLDGLRAIAAISVIAEHFSDFGQALHFPVGLMGLWLFFVLSGFLITGILLKAKGDAGGVWDDTRHAWRAFYVRRMLRIFPLYYSILIVAALMDLPGVRANLGWYLGHVANLSEILPGRQAPPFAHFWSLSVEEQFYLIWPTVVLLAPRRMVVAIAAAMVVVAPLSRLAMLSLIENFHYARVLPPSCLDGLGMGALLALLREGGITPTRTRDRFCAASLWVGLAILAAVTAAEIQHVGFRLPIALRYTGFTLVSVWLINRASDGFGGAAKAVLESRPLLYLGKISFGIYVIHLTVPWLIGWVQARTGVRVGFPAEPGPLQFCYVTAVSVALASLSWRFLEKPINDLKRFFPYDRVGPKPRASDPDPAEPVAVGSLAPDRVKPDESGGP